MFAMRGRRYLMLALFLVAITIFFLANESSRSQAKGYIDKAIDKAKGKPEGAPHPKYLPEPDWVPPPVEDPFPELLTSGAPPIPAWNKPKKDLYKDYGIEYAPPLLIGFTRTWPLLLQAVVSYITAGWPADQIYVVENTGVQWANAHGRLTLQNPFYLNHEALKKLGVNIIQAPVLMNFAQLQNFYTHLSHVRKWPYYFWSHMDVLALSYEEGFEGVTPPAGEKGYKTIYELCLVELNRTMHSDERWADKFFAYDHLTLVNRGAYDDVGGWDTFIPYYMNDCDMHSRLLMSNYSQNDARAGIITDVNAVLKNLRALYRDKSVDVGFTDPNPPPPDPPKSKKTKRDDKKAADEKKEDDGLEGVRENPKDRITAAAAPSVFDDEELAYWKKLQGLADHMFHYKHGDRGRNTWQAGQRGGEDEPFYYPSRGIAEAIDVLTEAGREVFRRKWGHRDCDLITGAGLQVKDQWKVAKDW
ncbi:hypothetical protein HJFPF1_08093 [Paramyrothecium foliicola]|nr:hypothetical protein HJFPF1_08093 [Paramyrothecium foliicola]